MKVTFIKHSCYSIETDNYFLVFDYIGGSLNFPEDKKIIFFVTHRHKDHFNPDIFTYNASCFILSDDIEGDFSKKTIKVSPDNTYEIEGLLVKTVGSTDEGVAFYVNADNIGIIHSGDLNHWVWDRYSKEEQDHMKVWFESEVDKFKNEKVDIVMMVVDPRMKDYYYLTGEYFLENIDAKYYFPMHMWEEFSISKKFKKKFKDEFEDKEIVVIHHDNEEFDLKI